jgi:uncharacterized membrane protein YeaQ/YmgE (transglycosylase-associated protein family)
VGPLRPMLPPSEPPCRGWRGLPQLARCLRSGGWVLDLQQLLPASSCDSLALTAALTLRHRAVPSTAPVLSERRPSPAHLVCFPAAAAPPLCPPAEPLCGAVLIAPTVMLTAASCTLPQWGMPRAATLFPWARIGVNTRRGGEYEIRFITGVLLHAGWNRTVSGRLAGWLAGWVTGCRAGRMAAWLAGCLAGWLGAGLAEWQRGWLPGCLAGWLAGWVPAGLVPVSFAVSAALQHIAHICHNGCLRRCLPAPGMC